MSIEFPPLPRRGQPEWYDDRTDWDNTVADLLKAVVDTQGLVDAEVTVTEGAQWDASLNITGGILQLGLTVPPGGEAFYRSVGLSPSANIDTIDSGVYVVTSSGTATSLGLPTNAPGSLWTATVYSTTARTQMFFANAFNGGDARIYVRQQLSGVWGPWTQMPTRIRDRALLPSGGDLDTLTEPDTVYGIGYLDIQNRPVPENGIVEVFRVAAGVAQRYTTIPATNPQVWLRRGNVSGDTATWFDWYRVDAGAVDGSSGSGAGPVRREMLQQGLRARKGGTIGTGGKGVVALRFDDAAGDFYRDVLPLLAERGLPFTRVTTTDRVGSTTGGEDDTWENIQSYCLEHGGEVWNHGKTHGDATGAPALDAEIVGALDTLRSNLPRIPIDCFSPPGGFTGWDGHLPSETVEQWAGTYAGQLIMGHHALASGYAPDSWYHPLDGVLRDGQVQYTCDIRDYTFVKNLIDRATDWGVGVSLMWHANRLDQGGYMSTSDFVAVLDYIVQLRDAGDIVVLTVSGMAVADKGTGVRENLLPVTTGADGLSTAVPYPNQRKGLAGATLELVAEVTGTSGGTVTTMVGESQKSHTLPSGGTATIYHPATVPLDVGNALPVTISAGAVADARLRPV